MEQHWQNQRCKFTDRKQQKDKTKTLTNKTDEKFTNIHKSNRLSIIIGNYKKDTLRWVTEEILYLKYNNTF